MSEWIELSRFKDLVCADSKILDVRSEGEFMEAGDPSFINLPILKNAERHQVGMTYKTHGQEAAIELGLSLVSGKEKLHRLEEWAQAIRAQRIEAISCARGGLRSQFCQQWLCDQGVDLPRIRGGYKAWRNFLLEEFRQSCERIQPILLTGLTGSGKTEILKEIDEFSPAIDLEELANHRGSSFGARGLQPSQASFENSLIRKLIQMGPRTQSLWLEDESPMIGHVYIPQLLFNRMKEAPRVELLEGLEARSERIVAEYILKEPDPEFLQRQFTDALLRLKMRLGSVVTEKLLTTMVQAFRDQEKALHREWVQELLIRYYDPLYKKHLAKVEKSIIFRGTKDEVLRFAQKPAKS